MDPEAKERGWLSQLIKKLAHTSEHNEPALIIQEIVFDDKEIEDDHQETQSDHDACSDAG